MSAQIWALLPVGIVFIAAVGWAVTQVVAVRNGAYMLRVATPEYRVIAVVGAALVAAALIGAALLATRGESFATAGLQRYISAPVIYGGFAVVVLASVSSLRRRWPIWVLLLIALTLISTLLSLVSDIHFTPATLLQGLVLILGAALFAAAGLVCTFSDKNDRRRLLQTLIGTGGVLGVLSLDAGVFSALEIPSAVLMVYLAVHRVRWWPLLAAAGLWVIIGGIVRNTDAIDPSAAGTGQLVVAGGLVLLATVPRPYRLAVLVVIALMGAWTLVGSDVPGLFIGRGADLTDVTLAQRAYETQAVAAQTRGNVVDLLVGGGPGATVDLTSSPDESTLAASGRVLAAVPSVHLLTSYLFLKLGLGGLAWFTTFLGAVVSTTVKVLKAKRPNFFDLSLLTFVLCGIIQAVPAGTFLFSNPLPALLLVVLQVRTSKHEGPTQPVIAASPTLTRWTS